MAHRGTASVISATGNDVGGASSLIDAVELRLDLFHERQCPLQSFRKLSDPLRLPVGNADGLGQASQRVFDDHPIFRAAEKQTDCGLVFGAAEKIVDSGQIDIHLSDGAWLERDCLQFENHVAMKAHMVRNSVTGIHP